ncbi:MAG TPA: type II toxin-antitoxin system RelE/ParE family toxin [Jatrophihabitans sp.]|nr:type II toxin-antitoxin system RelE/ParE family toxin [Jatrophihabitans sp.]
MSYRVEWSGPAQRDLARLPTRIAVAVLAYVDDRLAENPHRLSKPLAGELRGKRSARNGDYRVLFSIDDDRQIIWIIRVDHRAHGYRPR